MDMEFNLNIKDFKSNYVKTPTVYQMEATECGAASLAMILGYYGRYVSLEEMRIQCGVSRNGSNMANIYKAAKANGLKVFAFRMILQGLLNTKPPCIIHWHFNHFVVWEGIKGDYCYINDPARGRCKLTLEEVDDGFTGMMLSFEPDVSFQKTKKPKTTKYFIQKRLSGEYKVTALLIGVGLVLVIPGVILSKCSQLFIDQVLVEGKTNLLSVFLLVMSTTLIFQALLMNFRDVILARLKVRLSLISSYKMIRHMFRLPIQFFQQRSVGDLAYRVSNNDEVCDFIANGMSETLLNVFVASFYVILMIIYSPVLSIFAFLDFGLSVLLMKFSDGRMKDTSTKLKQDQGRLNGALISGLRITPTLKACGTESEYVSKLDGIYAKMTCDDISHGILEQILKSVTEMINTIMNILLLLVGGILVIKGQITAGTLVAFTTLMTSFLKPMNDLVTFVRSIQNNAANMRRVDDIENYQEDEIFNEANKIEMDDKLSGKIDVEGLTFGYSKLDAPLLSEISFHVQSGHSLAFVGESGSGKSTILKLLSGLYLPWSGDVQFDGVSLMNIPASVLSSSISIVSQEIGLFQGTIRDNITMFNDSILDSDIINATKDACIYDEIAAKENAFNHIILEDGSDFSGGQRQRLVIARALATNPAILIMDEATSALDPIVEKKILTNIKKRGITCVIIAHRLSAIRDCDEIMVMEKGKIVQQGTHEELIQVEGCYKRLRENG